MIYYLHPKTIRTMCLVGGSWPLSSPRLSSKDGQLGKSRVVYIPQMMGGLVGYFMGLDYLPYPMLCT
nr:hypothetical protein [Tanacetum cinerariifolium]